MLRDTNRYAEFRASSKDVRGRPLVLNRQKWNEIMKHLSHGKTEQIINENERRYKEYLKEESRAMTTKWENSLEKVRERKNEEKILKEQEKIAEGERRYKKLKENDENKRMEHILQAQDSIYKSKIGSRQLESAYTLSEILNTREKQCIEKVKFSIYKKEAEEEKAKEQILQQDQWDQEHTQKALESKKRKDGYKRQLFEQINENEIRQKEGNRNRITQEKQERETAEQDIRSQMEKERIALEKKKEAMRKNALEAMRIAEQRRLRFKMENEIEDKIMAVLAKENNINAIKKENDKKSEAEKNRLRQLIAQKLQTELEDREKKENEIHEKAVAENDQMYWKIEQNKIEINKKIKAARIQQHVDDMERQKKLKQQEKEQFQWDVANRLKNQQVDFEYDRQKKLELTKKTKEHRKILLKQMEETNQKPLWQYANEADKEYAADDKFFFKYAEELVAEAKAKNRPVYPLMKAIETYKKNNNLNEQKENLPHLKTNINIGLAEPKKYEVTELKKLNSRHSLCKPGDCSSAAKNIVRQSKSNHKYRTN